MRKLTILLLIIGLISIVNISCTNITLPTDYYSGFPISELTDRDEARYGAIVNIDGPTYMNEMWWYTIDYTDGTIVFYTNDSGDDVPDWETLLVVHI